MSDNQLNSKQLEVFGDKHKAIIDELAAGCQFEYWHDDILVDFIDFEYRNNFAEKLKAEGVSPPDFSIAVGRGFWEDGYVGDDFIALRDNIKLLTERTSAEWDDQFLKDATAYVEALKSAYQSKG